MKTAKFLTASVITRTAGPPMPEPFRQLCTLEPGLAELPADAGRYQDEPDIECGPVCVQSSDALGA